MKRFLRAIALTLVLFSLIPVSAEAEQLLIPVGQIIGLQLQDDTVTVAAYDDASAMAAKEAGVKIGDQIVAIDDLPIRCTADVRSALQACNGQIRMTIRRDGKVANLRFTPESTVQGPKLGIYLRQGIAGIGTITFYDPETGRFGTLGHGVSNSRGDLMHMKTGIACEAHIVSVIRGKAGNPGQLKGSADTLQVFGTLQRNTPQGVFGIAAKKLSGQPLPAAAYDQIQPGTAVILSTVTNDKPREYSVEILKIYSRDRSDGRNFLLRVTDPALLRTTGGIVQGMSGSPIIQNGKLVGAVTHVLVNQPDTGYGIFIENMLDAAG